LPKAGRRTPAHVPQKELSYMHPLCSVLEDGTTPGPRTPEPHTPPRPRNGRPGEDTPGETM
jgi:hypothetical protein